MPLCPYRLQPDSRLQCRAWSSCRPSSPCCRPRPGPPIPCSRDEAQKCQQPMILAANLPMPPSASGLRTPTCRRRPRNGSAWLLACSLAVLGVAVLAAVLTRPGRPADRRAALARRPRCSSPPPLPRPDPQPRRACSPEPGRRTDRACVRRSRADPDTARSWPSPRAPQQRLRREALRRSDADAHLHPLDGRLLPDLRGRPEHVRRQLAADRLDPHAGVGVLHRARHLPRAQLRRLLWRADAVQRHQRPGQHLAARQRLLHLRKAPRRPTTT